MDKSNIDRNTLFSLNSKIVLVTGATGQLGFTMCKSLIDFGARVIGVDIELNKSNMMQQKQSSINYFKLDITNKDSVDKVFKKLYQKYDGIDILINNAGVSTFEPFENRTDSEFSSVTNVNLNGTFNCIQNYAKNQPQHCLQGNIINIASIYGIVSPDYRIYQKGDRKNSEIYGATKAGVIQMTKYFAVHLAQHGIRVNSISPGGIYNPENPQSEHFINEYSKRNPMNRMANSEEILGAVLYLASDASSYVTGHNLVVDGGMSCW